MKQSTSVMCNTFVLWRALPNNRKGASILSCFNAGIEKCLRSFERDLQVELALVQ